MAQRICECELVEKVLIVITSFLFNLLLLQHLTQFCRSHFRLPIRVYIVVFVPHIVLHRRPFGFAALEFKFCCCYYYCFLLLVLFSCFCSIYLACCFFRLRFLAIVNYNLHLGARTGSCVYLLAPPCFEMFSLHTHSFFVFWNTVAGRTSFLFENFFAFVVGNSQRCAKCVALAMNAYTAEDSGHISPSFSIQVLSFLSSCFCWRGSQRFANAVYGQRKYQKCKNELFTLKFN